MFDVMVVGATGLVGAEIIRILAERNFALKQLRAVASSRSLGQGVEFGDAELPVAALEGVSFAGIDLVIFAVPATVSAEYVPQSLAAGCRVIDLSAHFAQADEACLAVAGLSGPELESAPLVATPSSAAVALSLVIKTLQPLVGIRHVNAVALLPVSHSGLKGIHELETQVRDLLSFQDPLVQLYEHQIAFNLLPQVGAFLPDGRTAQEAAIQLECARLLGLDIERLSVSCCLVPVFYGLGLNVELETETAVELTVVRDQLRRCPQHKLEDDLAHSIYPLPIYAAGRDEVCIGRLRKSAPERLSLFIAVDNLRRGSALNAVELAEAMLR